MTDPWLGFERKQLRSTNLTANILCRRHNSALSGLDTCAQILFRSLRDVRLALERGGGVTAVNGYDFERWLLKALCGLHAQRGEGIPELWVRTLFGQVDILPPLGLNINVRIGEAVTTSTQIVTETARDREGRCVGFAVTLGGLRFLLSLDGRRIYEAAELGKQSLFRPPHIRGTHVESGVEHVLAFTWHPAAGDGIDLAYAPPTE